MSNQVTYDPYTRRSGRNPTTFNNVLADLVTASGQVDATNIAEEGLDRRQFNGPIGAERKEYITETTQGTWNTTPYATLVFSGTTFRTSTLVIAANEVARIRARVWFETTVGAGLGVPYGATVQTRVRYLITSGAGVNIAESVREETILPGTFVNPAPSPHVVLSTLTWIDGAVNLDWIELQCQSSAQVNPSKAMLEVMLFRRVP